MKKFQKIIALFIVCVFTISSSSFTFAETSVENEKNIIASGNCGTSANWSVSQEGVLTISGTGAVKYSGFSGSDTFFPWSDYNDEIVCAVVEEGITSLPQGTFSEMSVLQKISMADSVTTLGASCFAYSTCLISVELSNNITSIPYNCFNGCKSLKNITLPENTTYIGEYSFYNCTNIREISIGDSVITIDDYAFCDCTRLKKVTIGSEVKNIGYMAFDWCPIEELYYNGTLKDWMGISFGTNGIIEKGYIYMQEDEEYKLIEHLIIPSDISKITENSLRGCSSIKSVTIPDTVALVESGAFNSCNNLETVVIDGVVTIEDAFSNCDNLRTFVMTGEVLNAKELRFSSCTSLENVSISDNIELGNYTFYGCSGLKEFIVPKDMIQIGDGMFFGCTNLTAIYMSKNITSIGEDAFDDCKNLKYIFYDGTEEEWNDITLNKWGNTNFKNAIVHYNSVGHNWNEDYTVDKEATCTEEGLKTIHCVNCDEVKDITAIPRLDHAYGDWIIDKEATCTENGSKHKGCSACGDKLTEVIEKTDHKMSKIGGIEATCTSAGWTEGSRCDRCGFTEIEPEEIPMLDHAYGDWIIDKEATCTESGSQYKECSACGDKVTKEIDATGHKWNEDYTVDKEATCAEEGSKSIHCANCDEVKDSVMIESVTHEWEYYVTVKAASCKETGINLEKCSICKELRNITIPVLNHSYKVAITKATCKSKGYTTYMCKCGDSYKTNYTKATGHSYSSYKTTKKAGFGTKGMQTSTCKNTNCTESKTKSISALKTPTLSTTTYTFNNKVKKPSVTVKNTADTSISKSVSYASGRKAVGKYAVKVMVNNANYYGTKTVYFKINPAKPTSVKLTKGKKQFKVSWAKPNATYRKQITGYQVRYATSSSKLSKAKPITVKGSSVTSKTIKNLKAKKKYYVQVRTYKTVNNVKYYSAWSAKKYVTTK